MLRILLETILPIVLSTFLKCVLLSYSYRSKSHGLRTSRVEQLRKYVGKLSEEANTLSTLHGIANCIKNRTVWKNVPPAYDTISPQSRPQPLSDRFENGTKTKLWKLMWTFLGCCIGSSGSPLHPPRVSSEDIK